MFILKISGKQNKNINKEYIFRNMHTDYLYSN